MGFLLSGLPTELRDQLPTTGRIDQRLRRLVNIDTTVETSRAGTNQLPWLILLIDQNRVLQAEIRRLDHPLGALLPHYATTWNRSGQDVLLCEVGDPTRFATEAKFARWRGVPAIALSSGEANGEPVRHRLDFRGNRTINSVLYTMSITQYRYHPDAHAYMTRKRAEGSAKEARRTHKRHLTNRIIRRMWHDHTNKTNKPTPTT